MGRANGVFAIGSDPKQMRAILEHHLRAPGGPPFDVVRCKPSFTRGRGSRSLFQYDVTLRSPEGREWNEVVSGVSYGGNRTRRAWDKLNRAGAEVRRESNIRRAAYVPDLDLLLQVFPFDHGLPALEPLMAGPLPGLHAPILARFGPEDWQLDEWQSECIRYRVDLRASVKLSVRATESRSGNASERRFYAKVYGGKEQVERAWTVQQDLAAAIQAAGDPFELAPLIAYLPEDRVLVQDEVPVISLPYIIRKDDPEKAVEAVRRAARAIAALHRLPIAAPQHRVEVERTDPGRVRRSAESLRNSRPDLTAAVAEIEKGIYGGLDASNELPSVPVHGDLKPPHILVEEERVVLLDLDKFAAGDPMLDVTSMLMPLRRERKTRLAGTSLADVFAEEYFGHMPATWEPRLAPLYAWALLREASVFAASRGKSLDGDGDKISHPERREHRVEVLVDEARAMLAGRA
jgi:Phosphotransferase enzyme family